MKDKQIFELDFILKTSPKVLENALFTQSGLADWFCDDVNIKDGIYSFTWNGYAEDARLISSKPGQQIKWQWLEDEEEGLETYFGFKIQIDQMTNAVVLTVFGSAYEEDKEETISMWEQHISDLKRLIGA